ncbi:MAG TPA: DnaJ family domain-containing protein [Roseateles sp.]
MKPDADTQRRTLLREQDDAIAEHLAASMRSGELQSAESFGKPLADAEGWAQTPLEFRLPFKILKNAGVPPPELELFKTRAMLREQLEAATDEGSRATSRQKLSELEQLIALRLESMRASGKI